MEELGTHRPLLSKSMEGKEVEEEGGKIVYVAEMDDEVVDIANHTENGGCAGRVPKESVSENEDISVTDEHIGNQGFDNDSIEKHDSDETNGGGAGDESKVIEDGSGDAIIEEIITIDDDGPLSGEPKAKDEDGSRRGVKRKGPDLQPQAMSCWKPYTQAVSCWKASRFLPRCRDCVGRGEHAVVAADEVCRFHQFRKLIKKQAGAAGRGFYVEFYGFCDPELDPESSDLEIWMPNPANPPMELPQDVCLQLLDHLGDQVCALIRQEQEAVEIEASFEGKNIPAGWKRLVEGIREMCDVCATTLFNYHWICRDCGFVACLECFKARKAGIKRTATRGSRECMDEFNWLRCVFTSKTTKTSHPDQTKHDLQKLQLTQILPRDCLKKFNSLLHEVRRVWNIPQLCDCPDSKHNGSAADVNGIQGCLTTNTSTTKSGHSLEIESILTSDANKRMKMNDSSDEDDDDSYQLVFTALKEFTSSTILEKSKPGNNISSDDPCKSSEDAHEDNNDNVELTNYVRPKWNSYYKTKSVPKKLFTKTLTETMYPNLPHKWLCRGALLRLEDPDYEQNGNLFQDVWKRGQPVLVSNVSNKLTPDLWTPESFLNDYGQDKNDLVNCLSGYVLPQEKVAMFWKGFMDVKERIRDTNGVPMLLKLKDWPATEDFAKFCPKRFDDLMQALPLKEYTHRTGRLNLAARLPQSFMRPDLGPKMYIAYGHGFNLEKGTTVLHLDISDAVNCMVFVGIPKNADPIHDAAVLKAIKESDCDDKMIQRVTEKKELPGALWHIYRPWDADKIRDLLNKVSVEQGKAIEPNHDPIHDQVMYLDEELRLRLRKEYNVVGFPIVQCAGDAVFIPAGAPHQVRNLHNCIKIAEDFVSPENVSHCFQLTEEFRNLSDSHYNHEDKLQIKNIVYHAVKDAMSVLMHARPLY